MQAGKLDREITIQQATLTQDSFGEPDAVWTDYATLWAQVIGIRAEERVVSGRVLAVKVNRFRTRYKSGITEKMRIKYDSDYYNVRGITEIGRQDGLELLGELIE